MKLLIQAIYNLIINLHRFEEANAELETLVFLEEAISHKQEEENWNQFFSCPKVNAAINYQMNS